jgi:hypothetical protein
MPTEKPRSRLVWRGNKTVEEIVNRLRERERILLVLPAGFHHAMSVHLGREETHGSADIAYGDAALARIARVKGLRELSELREPLARAEMDVRVRTPPPQILFFPRDTATWSRTHHRRHSAAAREPAYRNAVPPLYSTVSASERISATQKGERS